MARLGLAFLCAGIALAGAAPTRAQHPALIRFADAVLKNAWVPQLNMKLPTTILQNGLDPWPNAVDRPDLKVQDLRGLSSLYVENITVVSGNLSDAASTAMLGIHAKFLRNITAQVTAGSNDPFNVSVQGLRVAESQLLCQVDTMNLKVLDMNLTDFRLTYEKGVDGEIEIDDAPVVLSEKLQQLLQTELIGMKGTELYPVREGQDSSMPALLRLANHDMAFEVVPEVNRHLPEFLRNNGLDPLPTALDQDGIKVQDVKGLSSLVVENVTVASLSVSNSNTTATFFVNARFQRDVEAKIAIGDAPSFDPSIQGLRVAHSQIVASVETMSLRIMGMNLSEFELAYKDLKLPASKDSASVDKSGLKKILSAAVGERLQEEMTSLKGFVLYQDDSTIDDADDRADDSSRLLAADEPEQEPDFQTGMLFP